MLLAKRSPPKSSIKNIKRLSINSCYGCEMMRNTTQKCIWCVFFFLVGTPLGRELQSPLNPCGLFYLLRRASYGRIQVGPNWKSNMLRRGHLSEEIQPFSAFPQHKSNLKSAQPYCSSKNLSQFSTTSKPSSRKAQSYINAETKYMLWGCWVEGRFPLGQGQGQQLSRDVVACTVTAVPFVCT